MDVAVWIAQLRIWGAQLRISADVRKVILSSQILYHLRVRCTLPELVAATAASHLKFTIMIIITFTQDRRILPGTSNMNDSYE